MEDTSKLWNYFNKVYCISLVERKDRRKQAMSTFREAGLLDRVEFVLVRPHHADCEQGIYESHMSCIKTAIDAGADNVLVFEDDVVFDRFAPEVLKNCIDFLEKNQWDAFFLGCLVKKSYKTSHPHVLKIRYMTLAHAYALNRDFAIRLTEYPWKGIPFDDLLAQEKGLYYAAYPSFAFQGNFTSDNKAHFRLYLFRQTCGGLKWIQKMNGFYHRHEATVIILHLLGIFAIIMYLFLCL